MNNDKTNAPAMYFWGTPNNYAVKPSPKCDLKNMPGFSIFRRPISNKYPYQVVNLIDVYNSNGAMSDFPAIAAKGFWTSTSDINAAANAWTVPFVTDEGTKAEEPKQRWKGS